MATTRLLSAMVATWNNVATTFTGLKLNVTDTASASGSLLLDLQVGGASKTSVAKDGTFSAQGTIISAGHLRTTGGGSVQINSNTGALSFGSTADVFLARDAANTLALRNGTAAQKFNVYNTYTDASNYERGVFNWAASANTLRIGTEAAGTGSTRSLEFVTGGTGRWFIQAGGNLLASADNTYDIGASGANRPRNIFVAGLGSFANYVSAGGLYPGGSTRTYISSGSDGTLSLSNNAGTNSVQLTIGASNFLTLNGGLTTGGNVAVPGANGYFFSGVGSLTMPVSGGLQINDASATNTVRMTAGASNLLTLNGGLKTTGATFALQTATTLTDNAAAQVATMTNGPAAGNPTKWIAINDNGVTRYIPAW